VWRGVCVWAVSLCASSTPSPPPALGAVFPRYSRLTRVVVGVLACARALPAPRCPRGLVLRVELWGLLLRVELQGLLRVELQKRNQD
jgi:hypothetical protein